MTRVGMERCDEGERSGVTRVGMERCDEDGNQSEIISDLHRPPQAGGDFMPHWGAALQGGAAQIAAGLRYTAGAV